MIRYESALWETTALALHAGGDAVLVDPCISAPEIAAIAADVAARGLTVRAVLVTHADWDHVCGLSAFPDVPAIMSRGAAERIASGQAAEEVVRLGADEGLSWEGAPRADLVFDPGEALQVGPFTVETMALPGHTECGAGYRVRDLDLLCRRRLPLGHRVPVRVRLDGGLPCHARSTVRRARARSGRACDAGSRARR